MKTKSKKQELNIDFIGGVLAPTTEELAILSKYIQQNKELKQRKTKGKIKKVDIPS